MVSEPLGDCHVPRKCPPGRLKQCLLFFVYFMLVYLDPHMVELLAAAVASSRNSAAEIRAGSTAPRPTRVRRRVGSPLPSVTTPHVVWRPREDDSWQIALFKAGAPQLGKPRWSRAPSRASMTQGSSIAPPVGFWLNCFAIVMPSALLILCADATYPEVALGLYHWNQIELQLLWSYWEYTKCDDQRFCCAMTQPPRIGSSRLMLDSIRHLIYLMNIDSSIEDYFTLSRHFALNLRSPATTIGT